MAAIDIDGRAEAVTQGVMHPPQPTQAKQTYTKSGNPGLERNRNIKQVSHFRKKNVHHNTIYKRDPEQPAE
jgi:hypothetical protein